MISAKTLLGRSFCTHRQVTIYIEVTVSGAWQSCAPHGLKGHMWQPRTLLALRTTYIPRL